jgi:hypothetical protein
LYSRRRDWRAYAMSINRQVSIFNISPVLPLRERERERNGK